MDHKVMGSTPSRPRQSGFGQFLSIAGMIAGAAGTVLTAGAAAPAFAASAASMGAWGAGLTAGGSILAGLGSSPMMYNN